MSFDAAAPTYDVDFTQKRLGLWLRKMVRTYIPFQAGDHVLELGCGTGEDALWMAQQGIAVTATDASEQMLAVTRQKIQAAGMGDCITLQHLDLNAVGTWPAMSGSSYDGIFSNFGVLNCVADRPGLAKWLAEQIKPGGKAIFVVMSPLCPWEIGWYLLHGQIKLAVRRFHAGGLAHAGGGQQVRVWYPTPGCLRREFAPYFHHVRTVGIGTLLPPSYLDHLVDRWPGLFARLAGLDGHIGRYFPFTHLNDHYLMILERV